MNFYLPILVIVGSNVCYHISAKSLPASINPFASLGVTYLISAAVAMTLYFLTSPVKNLAIEYTHLNWTALALGIAIVGLEFGSINMYKVGWNISIGSLVANIALAVVLVLVGTLIYKDSMTLQKMAGIGLCVGGLILISK